MKSTENIVVDAVGKAMQEINRQIGILRDGIKDVGELTPKDVAIQGHATFRDTTAIVRKQIADAYILSYYHEMYELQTMLGYYWKPRKLTQTEVNAFVAGFIAGRNWKSRLQGWYKNYATAISVITHGLSMGIDQKDVNALIDAQTGFNGDSGLTYKVMRILRTETNNAMNRAAISAYKQAGVKRYRIVAILDDRTCRYCHEEQDGKIYEIRKMKKTVNLPPFHPNCRCFTEPMISREVRRTAKKRGTKERLSFEQWMRKYVGRSKTSRSRKKTTS